MRAVVASYFLLVISILVQSTWFGSIAVLGVIPDLSLVILLWISYKNGIVEGPVAGFLSGLAEDFISAAPLGFNAFVKTAVASATALLHGSFYIDRIILPFVLGFVGTLLKAVAAELLSLFFGDKVRSYAFLERVLWIEAAYNGVLGPIVFFLLSPLKKILVTSRGHE
jgi:rod shape-determining protein MreD